MTRAISFHLVSTAGGPVQDWPIDKLTAALAAADPSAIDHWYSRYFPSLFANAKRFSARDEATCLDIVQDAVLRILRNVRKVDSEVQLLAWQKLVVQTVTYDHLRAAQRRAARESHVARSRHESSPPADPSIDADDEIQRVRRHLADFDPKLVEMIDLRFDRGWTLGKIAEAMGLSVGTVDGRLRRAMNDLRISLLTETQSTTSTG